MRSIHSIVLGLTLAASVLGIACSTGSGEDDTAGADESNLTGSALATAKKSAARLTAAWTGAEPGPIAVVFGTFDSDDRASINFDRDTKHTPVDANDKIQTDRVNVSGEITKASSETKGTMEVSRFDFKDDKSFRILEVYKYEIKGTGDAETLTMTETKETITEESFDDDKPKAEPKDVPVKPPFTLKRASSWCSATFDAPNAGAFDCQSQFNNAWKPTDTPAMCKGKEENCMRCEQHACKMVKVSSCELDGRFCFESVDSCQFQNGTRAGQATTVSTEGKPVSCEGSRLSGRAVCCENIFIGRGEGEFD